MTKKTKIKLNDLEATNSEEVKGGGALSINTNPLHNVNPAMPKLANERPQSPLAIPGLNPKLQRGPR